MNIAEELAQQQTEKKEAQAKVDARGPETNEDAYSGTEMFNEGLPVGQPQKAAQEAPAASEEVQAEEPAQMEQEAQSETSEESKKIKIHGREFDTQEEAIKYAQSYIAEKQAQEDAAKEPEEKQEASPEELMNQFFQQQADMLFEDPATAMKNIWVQAVQSAKREIITEQTQVQEERKIWDNFYKENPKLSEFQDVVAIVHQKNAGQWANLSVQEGLSKLAEETKKLLKMREDQLKPREEMHTGPAQAASTGMQKAAAPQKEAPSLDMFSQISKYQNSKKKGAQKLLDY